jgi:glycosyltransferase involved in cell wall biosynthesis
MRGADAFVLSSYWEGFGNVVIEALASGAPAIVSDCDFGPREIVEHEKSGLIFKSADQKALTLAIDRVVEDKVLQARLREQGQIRAKDFCMETAIAKAYEDCILSELERKRKSL